MNRMMSNWISVFCLLIMASTLCAQTSAKGTTPKAASPAPVRPHLMAQLGHSGLVISVAFSPDDRFVLTGSDDHTARLWEMATGKEIRRFDGHSGNITSVTFSADGRYVLTGSDDHTARLWETDTGKEVRQFKGHSDTIESVAFSPDGRYVLTNISDTACLWEMATGKQLRQFKGHSKTVSSMTFSADGRYVLTGSWDDTARLWETATGKQIQQFTGHSGGVNSVALSCDARFVLTGAGNTARLWETSTGKEIQQFQGHKDDIVTSVAFSPNGHFVLANSMYEQIARLWETTTGKIIREFVGHSGYVSSVTFSADGRYVLTGSDDHTARLWETNTGKEVRLFKGLSSIVISIAFSADGRYVLTGSDNGTVQLYEMNTGKEIQQFEGHSGSVYSVTFCPDGRYVLTGSHDQTARLWETSTGKEIRQFQGHFRDVTSVAFSPDERFVLTGSGNDVRLWEMATGKQIRQFQGHSESVSSVAFSANGRFVLTALGNNACLWEMVTGKELRQFKGHSGYVVSVAFSPNDRYVLTGSVDGTTRLWETTTGKELCSLISFQDGSWAVIDPAGRYDASNPDKLEGLYWVANNEPIDLWQLKARYYEPGLLAKIISKQPLRNVEAFREVKFYPEIKPTMQPDSAKLNIELTNRGGGIGAVQVWVNGKEIAADARGEKPDVNAPKMTLTLDLSNVPGLKPGQPNEIRVTARNGEGYLQSRAAELVWTPPGKAAPAVNPELYAIVAGIGDYASPNLHLRLPPQDAAQIATALTLGAKRLFGADKVHLTLLSSNPDTPGALAPTKANFQQAFEAVQKQAKPEDILVVYFAGHGVAVQDSYYYLTTEARSFDLSDPDVRRNSSLSDSELAEWTLRIPALKQALILDTCAAGTAARKLTEARDVPGDQVRALDRLKDRTGFYVLMGCAADAVSYEASQYGQGLLTYALLCGMQGEKLSEGQFVDVSPLFEYAADRVPQLAEGVGGIQRPQVMMPAARNLPKDKQQASFVIGQMTPEDKRAITLPQPRPRILRFTLQSEDKIRDYLELGAELRKRLIEESEGASRGAGSPIYLGEVEAGDLPGAVLLNGRYRVEGDTVTVDLLVSRDGQDKKLTVKGGKNDLPGLAQKLVEAIIGAI